MVSRVVKVARGKIVHRAGVAVVALGFEAPTSNSAREVGSQLEREVAIADTGPTGVGARQARRLEEGKNDHFSLRILRAAKVSTIQGSRTR